MTSETLEYLSQESTHGTEELSVFEATHDVIRDPADRKLQTLTAIVYSIAKKWFGQEEVKLRKEPPRPSRRQTRIEHPKQEPDS